MRFVRDRKFSIHDQFLIFYIKEILQRQDETSKDQGHTEEAEKQGLSLKDIGNSSLQATIEKLTYMALDFWENVKQDQVDYKKLVHLNQGFFIELTKIESKYNANRIKTKQDIKVFFIYAQFLKLVVNQKDKSEELLRAVKKQFKYLTDLQNNDLDVGPNFSLTDMSFPAFLIDVSRPGVYEIIKINTEAEQFFGYMPKEISRVNLNAIIPEICREAHDVMINNYLQNINKKDKYRKKFLLGLHKQGYLVPFIVNTKYIESTVNNTRYLLACAINDPAYDNSHFMILDSTFAISNVS